MAKSLQDILKRRQQEEFVGREEQLSFFHRNLRWEVDDPRRRFVVSICGQGGVGKTWLLHRLCKIAQEFGALTALTDEVEEDVPSVMGCIAEQFETQGYSLKTFAERYKVYRQRCEEIEADPEAPQGFPVFLGRTLAKSGLRLARRVPVGGVVAEFVDEEAFVSLAGDFAAYVARKVRNKDEVRLVLEPVEILTPFFLADLREVAVEHPLALFFDTYERTGGFLDLWLRDLLEGRHGEAPANIMFTIAGQDELDRNRWAPYEGLLTRLSLESFTEEEARDYLARKGIAEERVVEVILHLSGRLPLLVVTLATESPDDPAKVGDPSGEAVERILKWERDPKQRQVALDAALPRRLNRDVLAVLVGEEEAEALFAWLRVKPFVKKRGDGWAYHDVVRVQMLRYKRQESPKGWADLHSKLAEYYEGLRDSMGLEEAGRKDETWQGYALEALYHRLCQTVQQHLPRALNGFIATLEARRTFARRWAETVYQAGKDVRATEVQGWGEKLIEGLKAYDEDRYETAAEMFTALLENTGLEERLRPVALDGRGYLYYLASQYPKALTDIAEAIRLAPEEPEYWADRGETYRQMEHYEEALADFSQAIELDPDYAWATASRGLTYQLMKRYEEALADFNRAIELEHDDVWAILSRGMFHRDMGHYEEALADFNRAIDLNPNLALAIAFRGLAYRQMRRYEESLADFSQAIELNPEDALSIACRGETYLWMDRYEESLADFNRAIELDPADALAIADRGETYLRMERYDDALADFNRAIELDPDYAFAIARRGETYRLMERYKEALADFNRAIELEPTGWRYYYRALVYLALNQPDKAHSDLTEATCRAQQTYEEDPTNWLNTFNLALYRLVAGETSEAEHLYREALSGGALPYRIHEAVRDLEDLLRTFPNHSQARAMRDLLQGHLQEAEQ